MADQAAPMSAGTQGFLFCDLRGYAAFVDKHGDLAAAELLATYRALVRDVIAEHAGAEIRTEGDSFYVVFPTASGALEAALGIVAAVTAASAHARAIRVGIGVHAGETVASAEGPIGGAVNIAARVCAKAEAGEVLVTDTVRSLTRTLLPYRFVGLGPQRLKGVGSIPLYRVEATSAGRAAHLRRRLAARRRLVGGVALLAAVALVGGSAAWVVTRPAACLTLGPETKDVVARIDPARGCVVATVPVGRGPAQIVAAGDKLWVANVADGTVTVLSSTGDHIATVEGGKQIAALASDGAVMWVLDEATGWVSRYQLEDVSALRSYPLLARGRAATESERTKVREALDDRAAASWYEWLAGDYRGMAGDDGNVWLSNGATGRIVKFSEAGPLGSHQADKAPDPVAVYCGGTFEFSVPCAGLTGPPTDARPLTGPLAIVGQAVWAGHETSTDLTVLDLGTGVATPCAGPTSATGHASALATIGDDLWVAYSGGQVARVGGCGDVRSEKLAESLTSVGGATGAVWATSDVDHVAIRLDPRTLDVVAKVDVGGPASGVAVAPDGSVWVTVSE